MDYGSELQQRLAQRVDIGMGRMCYTQSDLAREARISEKHLSQMLNGRVQGSLAMWDHLLWLVGMKDVAVPDPDSRIAVWGTEGQQQLDQEKAAGR